MADKYSSHALTKYDEPPTWRQFGVSLAYTALFCLGIAVLLWSLEMGITLRDSLIVSFSIGWSVNLTFLLVGLYFSSVLSPYFAPVPPTLIGLGVGLIVAGTLVAGRPLMFYTEDYATLILGIFFSVIGFLVFATRTRLAQIEARLIAVEMESERQERLVVLTELKLLQAQIEPHFLFNTLSNIAGLIHKRPDDAEKTLVNLTHLLRSSLSRTRKTATTVTEEMDIARAYLEIHKIRMNERLQYHIVVGPEVATAELPPLLIQPLVENAITHGIDQLEQGGTIHIEASHSAANPSIADKGIDLLRIVVTDTGSGLDTSGPTHTGTGTGLNNVRDRLHALYGADGQCTLTDNPQGSGTCAVVTIPFPRK